VRPPNDVLSLPHFLAFKVLTSPTLARPPSVIATAELVGSLLVSLLTLAAPLAALALVVLFLWLTIYLVRHWIRGAHPLSNQK
jgi:putative effector of murein hydrolase LrgA (UPF0299 family)